MDSNPEYTRYFSIAQISVQVEADIPIMDDTFDEKFKKFQIDAQVKILLRYGMSFQ
jgi:hypothetical protein